MQVPETQGAVYQTYGLTAIETTLILGEVLRAAKARASRKVLKSESLKTSFPALPGR